MEAALCIFEQSPILIMKCYAGKTEVGKCQRQEEAWGRNGEGRELQRKWNKDQRPREIQVQYIERPHKHCIRQATNENMPELLLVS